VQARFEEILADSGFEPLDEAKAKALRENWVDLADPGHLVTAEEIVAKAGNDRVLALSGSDRVRAGSGNDTVFGNSGRDRISGGEDNDTIDAGAGADVAYGQDVIRDGFLPVFGTGDPLQVGFLLAFAAQFSSRASIETLYDMATVNGARIMRRPGHGIAVGQPADLIVVAAPSVQEAYRTQAPRVVVVHDGRVVARNGRIVDG